MDGMVYGCNLRGGIQSYYVLTRPEGSLETRGKEVKAIYCFLHFSLVRAVYVVVFAP